MELTKNYCADMFWFGHDYLKVIVWLRSTLDALLNALILFALFLKVEGCRYNERENICHEEKNIYNTE